VRFGSLEFVSGLVLTSSFRGFGGLSGLRLDAKGEHFTALSDKGDWFTGRLVYRGKQLAGLANVETAPILGPDGVPVGKRGWFDTESLAIDGTTAMSASNGSTRSCASRRLAVTACARAASPSRRRRRCAGCLSTRAGVAGGGAEQPAARRHADGDLRARARSGRQHPRVPARRPVPGQFTIRRSNDFDISDAAVLPSGALLILERKFSLVAGVGIRIRRIPLTAIVPDGWSTVP